MPSHHSVQTSARVGTYIFDAPEGYEHEMIEVVNVGETCSDRVWRPTDVWAVRKRGWCLDIDGDWVYEPLPSSRDEDFKARCRFTLDEALVRAEQARDLDNLRRSDSR